MNNSNTNKPQNSISVIGLGKLGCPLAAVLSHAGYQVIGYDLNESVVELINASKAPVKEPQLQEYIDLSADRLSATNNLHEAILNTDITFIIVPTPSMEDHLFSNDYLVSALVEIGKALKEKDSYHLICVNSTVVPGSMDKVLVPTVEQSSGKKIGDDTFGMCYNPEFIALGSVIQNMLYPDVTLIGESSIKAGDLLQSVYQQVCQKQSEVHRMNFVNAELTKISINTYVTTKISYANMLAEMCENLPNADVDVVTEAVGGDSRIGRKYLKGAIGYAGPCFPRDNRAFIALGEQINVNCDIARATDAINDRQIDRLIRYTTKFADAGASVSVLGLAYKVDTPEIDCSQGVMLCNALSQQGYLVRAYDPLANTNASKVLDVTISDTLIEAMDGVGVIIITTPWKTFDQIPEHVDEGTVIIDPWGVLEGKVLPDGCTLIQMGKDIR